MNTFVSNCVICGGTISIGTSLNVLYFETFKYHIVLFGCEALADPACIVIPIIFKASPIEVDPPLNGVMNTGDFIILYNTLI